MPILQTNTVAPVLNRPENYPASTKLLILTVPTGSMNSIEVTLEDVHKCLVQLNPTKAMGCDQIHPSVLKLCADSLEQPLCELFTNCLRMGVIPTEWKTHKICRIPKSGNPLQVENYRPISLLCIIGKVLEKLVYNKIISRIRPKLSGNNMVF